MQRKFLRFLPAIIWGILILLTSLISGDKVPHVKILYLDKIVHFGLYFVFCWLITFGLLGFDKKTNKSTLLVIVIITSFYGFLMEYLQEALNEGRTAELNDALANVLGAVFAALLFDYSQKLIQEFRKNN